MKTRKLGNSSLVAEIERAAAAITVEGERYPAHLLATTGR
jgi:hypothetical protein